MKWTDAEYNLPLSTREHRYSGAKKYLVSHQLCKFSHLKRWEACNFHHRYTSTMRDKMRMKKSRKSHCLIFKEFICKLWWKISIWSITKTSGDWLGHSRTLKCFLRSHSFVARAVCLGSLSCWKTQPCFIFNALADGRRFSLKISQYMAPFILSFTRISRPGPLAEKQPQSMMFPPPCFTVGMVFFGCNSAFFLLPTRRVEFLPKSSILVSSDHMTFSQSSSGSSKCSLANFRRAWTCTGLSRGTRLALQDLSPWQRSVLLMVAFVTLVPALCRSFTRSPRVVLGFLFTMSLWSFWPHGVRSCVEPQIEGDYQWSCMSSIF